jgi:uncharacterized membrane protein YoaK (UPF0700 family)
MSAYLMIGAIALAAGGLVATRAPSAYLMIGAIAVAACGVLAAGYADAYEAASVPPAIAACESDSECEAAAASLCESGIEEWCNDE